MWPKHGQIKADNNEFAVLPKEEGGMFHHLFVVHFSNVLQKAIRLAAVGR